MGRYCREQAPNVLLPCKSQCERCVLRHNVCPSARRQPKVGYTLNLNHAILQHFTLAHRFATWLKTSMFKRELLAHRLRADHDPVSVHSTKVTFTLTVTRSSSTLRIFALKHVRNSERTSRRWYSKETPWPKRRWQLLLSVQMSSLALCRICCKPSALISSCWVTFHGAFVKDGEGVPR